MDAFLNGLAIRYIVTVNPKMEEKMANNNKVQLTGFLGYDPKVIDKDGKIPIWPDGFYDEHNNLLMELM